MNESLTMRGLYWAFLLVLAFVPLYSISIVINNGWEGLAFSIVPLIGGVMIGAGLLTMKAGPRRAVFLTVIGCLMVVVGWFWLFPITIPVSIGLIAYSYKRWRRFSQPVSPAPA
jgi:hypothetical protein